jgi:aldose 1-epimerase
MKTLPNFCLRLLVAAFLITIIAASSSNAFAQGMAAGNMTIGGEPVVSLKLPPSQDTTKPHFISATVLPGRGMNLLQVKIFLPGKGEVNLLESPALPEAKQLLDQGDDEFGNKGFQVGAAILFPYLNRIRGKLSADGKTISTDIAGKTISLPANWHGKNPGAEVVAMHGQLLSAKFGDVQQHAGPDSSSVSATLHGGDFDHHWLSKTDVTVHTVLKPDALEMTVTAKNVGTEALPVGITFHPWFRLQSGDRQQVKLHVPGSERALVNNYDDVFPTGKVEPVKGTPYDFTAPGGKALGTLFMDDNFLDLQREKNGSVAVEVTDPAANYGLRVSSPTPQVKAIQIYAPLDRNVIVVEPQFNLADPYNKVWGKRNTGMVSLQPGQSVTWKVRLELFTPEKM